MFSLLYTAFKRLSKLSKLQELELRFNNLNETILPYVSALQSLKMLDVGLNKFKGPLPIGMFICYILLILFISHISIALTFLIMVFHLANSSSHWICMTSVLAFCLWNGLNNLYCVQSRKLFLAVYTCWCQLPLCHLINLKFSER